MNRKQKGFISFVLVLVLLSSLSITAFAYNPQTYTIKDTGGNVTYDTSVWGLNTKVSFSVNGHANTTYICYVTTPGGNWYTVGTVKGNGTATAVLTINTLLSGRYLFQIQPYGGIANGSNITTTVNVYK